VAGVSTATAGSPGVTAATSDRYTTCGTRYNLPGRSPYRQKTYMKL
jgi:hypothetical protein